jgi:3-hydroxypropanoate dehydrogenase
VGERVNDQCIDVVLRTARTQNGYLPKPVSDDQLREIYDLMKLGPTSANCSPARLVFVRTPEGKARLLPALSAGNQDKTKQAPVTVIVGYDTKFYELLPTKLFTHRPEMKDPYEKSAELAETVAFRNSTLQGAYFMLAARMLGLDVGGMSGFDNKKVDAEFFPEGRIKSNFLINVGHGDPSKVMPKLPRFTFEEACSLV